MSNLEAEYPNPEERFSQRFLSMAARIESLELIVAALGRAVGYIDRQTDSNDRTSSGTTELDIISKTMKLVAGRRYEVTLFTHFVQSVSGDVFALRVYINGTRVLYMQPLNTVAHQTISAVTEDYLSPTSGSFTVKATIQRQSGSGTGSMNGASYVAGKLILKDIGI